MRLAHPRRAARERLHEGHPPARRVDRRGGHARGASSGSSDTCSAHASASGAASTRSDGQRPQQPQRHEAAGEVRGAAEDRPGVADHRPRRPAKEGDRRVDRPGGLAVERRGGQRERQRLVGADQPDAAAAGVAQAQRAVRVARRGWGDRGFDADLAAGRDSRRSARCRGSPARAARARAARPASPRACSTMRTVRSAGSSGTGAMHACWPRRTTTCLLLWKPTSDGVEITFGWSSVRCGT